MSFSLSSYFQTVYSQWTWLPTYSSLSRLSGVHHEFWHLHRLSAVLSSATSLLITASFHKLSLTFKNTALHSFLLLNLAPVLLVLHSYLFFCYSFNIILLLKPVLFFLFLSSFMMGHEFPPPSSKKEMPKFYLLAKSLLCISRWGSMEVCLKIVSLSWFPISINRTTFLLGCSLQMLKLTCMCLSLWHSLANEFPIPFIYLPNIIHMIRQW